MPVSRQLQATDFGSRARRENIRARVRRKHMYVGKKVGEKSLDVFSVFFFEEEEQRMPLLSKFISCLNQGVAVRNLLPEINNVLIHA